MNCRTFYPLLLASLLLTSDLSASELTPEKVTVYEGNKAHHIHEGVLTFENGYAITSLPENPLYGTYWMSSVSGLNLTFMYDSIATQSKADSPEGLLKALTGQKITIAWVPKDGSTDLQTFSGKLVETGENAQVFRMFNEEKQQSRFFLTNDIRLVSIDAPVGESPVSYDKYEHKKVLRVSPVNNERELPVSLHYLSNSVGWEAFYRIKVSGSNSAGMDFKARIHNNDDAMEDVELAVTIGQPEVAFGDKPESFIPEMRTQQVRVRDARVEASTFMSDAEFIEVEPVKSDVFYRYNIGRVSIPEKSHSEFSIFSRNINFEEHLRCNIPDLPVTAHRGQERESKTYPVWLSMNLTNDTGHPWAEGSVLIEDRNGEFIAQQKMLYTPTGSERSLNIAREQDILVTNSETIASRESGVRQINGRSYGKVKMKGEIVIQNHSGNRESVEIRKRINGRVLSTGQGGQSRETAPLSINPDNLAEWTVAVDDEEEIVLKYEYEAFYRE